MKRITIGGVPLTARMVELLLEHADGPRPTRAFAPEMRVLKALWMYGLITFHRRNRPKFSVVTSRGRECMTALLARQRASALLG